MIETLNNLDTQLFYFINGHHCTAMDWVMWVFTTGWSWAIIIVAAYLALNIKKHSLAKDWWLVLAAIGLCFLLADQGSVQLFKNTVCRLRPCHALENVHMFREGCGGRYGFISSHAANSFAVAMFLFLHYRRTNAITQSRTNAITYSMLLWAFITSYSRAYLGKHYPGDLICGALFGILVAFVVQWVTTFVEKKLQKVSKK